MKTYVRFVPMKYVVFVSATIAAFLTHFYPPMRFIFISIDCILVYTIIKEYKQGKEIRRLCSYYESASQEEQRIVVFCSDVFFKHALRRNKIPFFYQEHLNYFKGFLDRRNLFEDLMDCDSEVKKVYLTAIEIICEFLDEHRRLLKEDRAYYKKGTVVDEYIMKQRWALEKWVASFKARWHIWPTLDPYVE